jgi:hypothetical protein
MSIGMKIGENWPRASAILYSAATFCEALVPHPMRHLEIGVMLLSTAVGEFSPAALFMHTAQAVVLTEGPVPRRCDWIGCIILRVTEVMPRSVSS